MKSSTGRLVVSGYAIALVVLGIVALLALISTNQYVKSVAKRRAATVRIDRLSNYLSLIKDAETGQRGYLLIKQEELLVPYREALAKWRGQYDDLVAAYESPTREEQVKLELLRHESE